MGSLLKYSISKKSSLLFLIDSGLILTAIMLAFYIRLGNIGLVRNYFSSIVVAVFVYSLTFYIAELYDFKAQFSSFAFKFKVIAAVIIGSFILSGIYFFLPGGAFGRGILLLVSVFLTLEILLWRFIFSWFMERIQIPSKKLLIIGTDGAGGTLLEFINGNPGLGLEVVGFIDDGAQGKRRNTKEINIVGNQYDLSTIVRKEGINTLILAMPDGKNEELIKSVLDCKMAGVKVYDMPTFYEKITGKLPVKHIEDSWFVFAEGFGLVHGWLAQRLKRVFDIILSLMGLVFAAPLMGIVVLSIKLDSPGPVIYRQERVGKDGKIFNLMKFRSMSEDAEDKSGPVWSCQGDLRVSRVGKVLRPTRLDEIPQLFNVLKGDMSFIGPRPERPFFVEQLKKQIPYYSLRFAIKPGITGWAQVKYHYGASVEDAMEKLQYDLYYIKNMSFYLEAYILLKTLQVILFAKEY